MAQANVSIDGYEVLALLGQGGFAQVYRARDTSTGAVVVVKLPRADRTEPRLLDLFRRECELLLTLAPHPNVIGATRLTRGRHGEGPWLPALVMPAHSGVRPITTYADEEGLDRPERLALLAQACRGVDHLSRAGLAHLDLKPSNILVAADGVPRIADLGATRRVAQPDVQPVVSTPGYAPPEQARGDPLALDQASDVYALGMVLLELLHATPAPPLPDDPTADAPAPTPAGGQGLQSPDAGLVRRLDLHDRVLARIVARAIDPRPSHRYRTAHEFGEAIARHRAPWGQRATLRLAPVLGAEPAPPRPVVAQRTWIALVLLASITAAALVIASLYVSMSRSWTPPLELGAMPVERLERVRIVRLTDDDDLDVLRQAVPELDPARIETFRAFYGALVRRLIAARPRAIVFDIDFDPYPASEPTQQLAEAIRSAVASGVPVVLGLWETGPAIAPHDLDPLLLDAGSGFGYADLNEVVAPPGQRPRLGVPVVIVEHGKAPRHSMAAAAVLGGLGGGQIELDVPQRQLRFLPESEFAGRLLDLAQVDTNGERGPNRFPLFSEQARVAMHLVTLPSSTVVAAAELAPGAVLGMDDPALGEAVGGKFVVISTNRKDADIRTISNGERWPGVYLQSLAIETIDRVATVLFPGRGFAILALAMAFAGAAIGTLGAWRLARRPPPGRAGAWLAGWLSASPLVGLGAIAAVVLAGRMGVALPFRPVAFMLAFTLGIALAAGLVGLLLIWIRHLHRTRLIWLRGASHAP